MIIAPPTSCELWPSSASSAASDGESFAQGLHRCWMMPGFRWAFWEFWWFDDFHMFKIIKNPWFTMFTGVEIHSTFPWIFKWQEWTTFHGFRESGCPCRCQDIRATLSNEPDPHWSVWPAWKVPWDRYVRRGAAEKVMGSGKMWGICCEFVNFFEWF